MHNQTISLTDYTRGPIYDEKGNYYRGERKKDKKHGYGTQVWKDKNLMYTGFWHNNKRHGLGELSYINSKYCYIYSGSWKNDKRNGFGTHYYERGMRYEGTWHKDKRNGYGNMRYKDGSTYSGDWIKDERCGEGTMVYADGSVYFGQWLNDMRSGIGTLISSNKDIYKGSWKYGMKHGEGFLYISDTGVVLHGAWICNALRGGSLEVIKGDHPSSLFKLELPPCLLEDPDYVIENAIAHFVQKGEDKINMMQNVKNDEVNTC